MADISLIIPTYGRYREVEDLIKSISKQSYPLAKIEVIVIDQNDSINITPIINSYKHQLTIIHKKTAVKGIAKAKNLGLKLANAPVISFPDDDCFYYEDTVSSALNFLKQNSETDVVYGRVYDRKIKANIMRNWPNKNMKLNLYNFHLNYSAITCFTRLKNFFFDERFGVGAKYVSGEELDYIISALEQKHIVQYTNTIDIWHPQLDVSIMPLSKIYNYAEGYGAVCKKHFSFSIFFLFFKSTLKQLLLVIFYGVSFNKDKLNRHTKALKGRINGFAAFKN